MRVFCVWASLCFVVACGDKASDGGSSGDGGAGADGGGAVDGGGDVVTPPTPAADAPPLPQELVAAARTDEHGHVVVFESEALAGPGLRIGLTYQAELDDPITRLASCLQLVRVCAADVGSFDACIAALPPCETDEGGAGCCSPACIAGYAAARQTTDLLGAVDASFLGGTCVTGLAELLTAPPEVSP